MPQKRIEIDGVVHEFPADFTDAEIAAALGDKPVEGAQKKAGLTTPGGIPMDVAGGFLPDRKTAGEQLPMALATTAGALTGGTSLPILAKMAATGGGGVFGSLLKSFANRAPAKQAIAEAATEGALQGFPEAAGAAKFLKGPLQRGGQAAWRYAAGGGSKTAAKEILEEGAGTLTKGNLARLESPRSATGAFQPRTVSPNALKAMRSGVERASQGNALTLMDVLPATGTGYVLGPKAGLALAVAKQASKPLPASAIAQGMFSLGHASKSAGRTLPPITRAALIASLLGADAQ